LRIPTGRVVNGWRWLGCSTQELLQGVINIIGPWLSGRARLFLDPESVQVGNAGDAEPLQKVEHTRLQASLLGKLVDDRRL